MATVLKTIELPAETVADIDTLVSAGHASSRAALVAGLVARQAERQRAFDAAIEEGLASGSSGVTLEEILAEARRRHGRS
ncbi:ribbon-helix-helix domain-containing protein [Sandarakinorhabdus sp.]|uniref:ribbon-helix-helix domain-containing protein n=1 Tax=Sandarakinorhabdus sp. TaxID=1916663 RepID=UPI003F7074EA